MPKVRSGSDRWSTWLLHWKLTDEERVRGDTMMLCVSRARSGPLVLDL
ncbi:hypothetical protein [Nocardia abscessus]|nr:hypothetical protein [Nocardia abscessus]